MKIFNVQQIRACDNFTIETEPIASIDLMERAASACTNYIIKKLPLQSDFIIFCGKGNNGGDGLAIARQLLSRNFSVRVLVVDHSQNESADFKVNSDRLILQFPGSLEVINKEADLASILFHQSSIVIDALLGTGVNKPAEGILASAINFINGKKKYVVSIDMPSGLYADSANDKNDPIIKASITLTFQFPKFSFLMPQNQNYVPVFSVLDIGLSKKFIDAEPTRNYFITKTDLQPLLKSRSKFSHKGIYGHALLVAGSYGKMGAAVIAAKACLRSGAGLLTVHVPKKGVDILQTSLPEAMISVDENETMISALPKLDNYDAIGIGPGIGTEKDTEAVMKQLLNYASENLVIDADALNILSQNKTLLSFLPVATILTPHVKEFDRLTQNHTDDFDRLQSAKDFSVKFNCIVVLKSAFTQIVMPDGNVFFNSNGNAGLAKGGSGDMLTGIILGLLARGYNAPQAALVGVFVHGLAADMCARKMSEESILASDVIEKLPRAFVKMYS
jgi:hydroxyethylthiazole kinase-like uncharacterized protein yjeF